MENGGEKATQSGPSEVWGGDLHLRLPIAFLSFFYQGDHRVDKIHLNASMVTVHIRMAML